PTVLKDCLRAALDASRVRRVDVTREDIAATLGSAGVTNAAIAARLRERHPLLAQTVRTSGARAGRGPRSESERYWEPAAIAAAAALTFHRHVTHREPSSATA